jgi:hypothetical protein
MPQLARCHSRTCNARQPLVSRHFRAAGWTLLLGAPRSLLNTMCGGGATRTPSGPLLRSGTGGAHAPCKRNTCVCGLAHRCPPNENPADFLIDCIDGTIDCLNKSQELARIWREKLDSETALLDMSLSSGRGQRPSVLMTESGINVFGVPFSALPPMPNARPNVGRQLWMFTLRWMLEQLRWQLAKVNPAVPRSKALQGPRSPLNRHDTHTA